MKARVPLAFRALTADGTMNMCMVLRRYETAEAQMMQSVLPPTKEHLNGNTCVLTVHTLYGGLLVMIPVQNDNKLNYVVKALESAVVVSERADVQWLVVDSAQQVTVPANVEVFPEHPGGGPRHMPFADQIRGGGRQTSRIGHAAPACGQIQCPFKADTNYRWLAPYDGGGAVISGEQ